MNINQIDIKENYIYKLDNELLSILLKDLLEKLLLKGINRYLTYPINQI